MLLRWVRIQARFCSNIVISPDGHTALLQAASRRSVERRRIGLPPGGLPGPPSSAQSASRISAMVTGAFSPSGALSDGQDAIAEASEAHDARMARFSASVRPA